MEVPGSPLGGWWSVLWAMGSHGRILSGDFLGWDILMIMWRTMAWREHDLKQESY